MDIHTNTHMHTNNIYTHQKALWKTNSCWMQKNPDCTWFLSKANKLTTVAPSINSQKVSPEHSEGPDWWLNSEVQAGLYLQNRIIMTIYPFLQNAPLWCLAPSLSEVCSMSSKWVWLCTDDNLHTYRDRWCSLWMKQIPAISLVTLRMHESMKRYL